MAAEDAELVRYWFTFDVSALEPEWNPRRVDDGTFASRLCGHGVGVTGYDEADCLELVGRVLHPEPLPPLVAVRRDVDVDALGLDHRFVGVPVWRGIWFPNPIASGPVLS